MNNYEKVGLYEHNIESYEKVRKQFEKDNFVALVQATGTGKTYNALQLAYDNPNEKIIYVVPGISIIEHIKEVINSNPNLDLERDFKNVEFRTYQSFINLSSKELKELNVSLLILDEFHHIGAPIWGARINEIIETHPNIKVFGMTAYTVRDRGTSYERDMVNPEGEEIFSNKVASNYDLCDAMIDAVLPKPIYKSAYIHLEKTLEELEIKLEKENHNTKNYKELSKILNDIRNQVHMAPSMKDVFKENIKKDGKYYYFCPLNNEENVNDIGTIMEEVKEWCQEMGLTEDDYEFYLTTSEMKEEGKKNRQAFYNDEDLDGNKVNQKLRIMFAINQYNEGVHAPGVDGVIMGRSTKSDIVYYEQLGRGLSVRENYKEEYDKLYQKDIAELRVLCKERNREIKDDMEKEEIIETLLAPIIIDLANNIDYIKELENNLKDRVKEVRKQNNSKTKKRVIHLSTTDFNISMINQNLYEILKYTSDRLSMTWMNKYNLAKAYYEHLGNLEMPNSFKTINGYEYDEYGIALGTWINTQRQAYKGNGTYKITKDQIKLLEEIGMRFEIVDKKELWMDKYNLAKIYYEHYSNLEIPQTFK
ncbi:MAG: Helicase associated domain protein, partial [Tenericutes bacterium]|nr:Helicase associated domain protein [Mycoplasmatota bacterium]